MAITNLNARLTQGASASVAGAIRQEMQSGLDNIAEGLKTAKQAGVGGIQSAVESFSPAKMGSAAVIQPAKMAAINGGSGYPPPAQHLKQSPVAGQYGDALKHMANPKFQVAEGLRSFTGMKLASQVGDLPTPVLRVAQGDPNVVGTPGKRLAGEEEPVQAQTIHQPGGGIAATPITLPRTAGTAQGDPNVVGTPGKRLAEEEEPVQARTGQPGGNVAQGDPNVVGTPGGRRGIANPQEEEEEQPVQAQTIHQPGGGIAATPITLPRTAGTAQGDPNVVGTPGGRKGIANPQEEEEEQPVQAQTIHQPGGGIAATPITLPRTAGTAQGDPNLVGTPGGRKGIANPQEEEEEQPVQAQTIHQPGEGIAATPITLPRTAGTAQGDPNLVGTPGGKRISNDPEEEEPPVNPRTANVIQGDPNLVGGMPLPPPNVAQGIIEGTLLAQTIQRMESTVLNQVQMYDSISRTTISGGFGHDN